MKIIFLLFQIEMAEDVKKVHETEVSRLRKAVSVSFLVEYFVLFT